MIPASYYHNIYLFIITLMTFYAMSQYNRLGKQYNSKNLSTIVSLLLLIFMTYFIGTRPISGVYFQDMFNYSESYDMLFGERFWFDWDTENLIFDNWFSWMASKTIPYMTWIWLMSLGYFGLMFVACWKLFKKNVLLSFVVYLAAFSTFSYGTNGMKAGLAASIFLVSIAYSDILWISIPIALLTYGFHHSMAFVITAYFVVLLFKNPKYYFWGWIACAMIAVSHISFFQIFFAGFTDEHGAEYLLATEGSANSFITGFRPDFMIYSAVPIYLGYQLLNKYNYQSVTYLFILRLYILTNAMWMLCMYASFTNRIAYLSWFIYPFVLLYPFINCEKDQMQGKYLRYVVYGHLGFTLFMNFIYY